MQRYDGTVDLCDFNIQFWDVKIQYCGDIMEHCDIAVEQYDNSAVL